MDGGDWTVIGVAALLSTPTQILGFQRGLHARRLARSGRSDASVLMYPFIVGASIPLWFPGYLVGRMIRRVRR